MYHQFRTIFHKNHHFSSFVPKNSHYKTIFHQIHHNSRILLQINHFRTIPHKKHRFNCFLQKTNHYRAIFCKKHHYSSFSPKNSYCRTIFHQKLNYRTILSTFQHHQLSIAQNNITNGHQAPNTSSHLENHLYCQHQYTHINNIFQDHYPATVSTIGNKVFQDHTS